MRSILRWIDDQTGLVSDIERFLAHPLPSGVSWPQTIGAVILFLLAIQFVTGIFLALYYAPTPDHAYDSIQFIRSIYWGRLVLGLHHYTTDAIAFLVGVHILRVFLWGAYKKPRQIIWVIGILLLTLTMAFTITGSLLPWDQNGYWATTIRMSLAGSLPIVGHWLKEIILGGHAVGTLTLTRFYAIHVFFLPAILVILLIFHVFQVRVKGITPPWRRVDGEQDVEKPLLFHPDHTIKIMICCTVIFVILVLATLILGFHLTPPANPNLAYPAHTDWYFLYLFELAHLFSGKWEFIGGMVIPGITLLAFILVPYLDRNPERKLARRPISIFLAGGVFIAVTALSMRSLPTIESAPKLTPLQQEGQKLFLDLHCQACHGINGGGGTAGPDLASGGKLTKKTIEEVLLNPTRFNPRSIMPPSQLNPHEIIAMVSFIQSIRPTSTMPSTPQIGPPEPQSHLEEGFMLNHRFEVMKDPQSCAECHQPRFCQACHRNRKPDSHLHHWLRFHAGASAANPKFCLVCHSRQQCDQCHRKLLHGPYWLKMHRNAALKNKATCYRCHTPTFCRTCHQGARPPSHQQPDFLQIHGKLTATHNCAVCHTPNFCVQCHQGARPVSHRAPDFIKQHGRLALSGTLRCSACHKVSFCQTCHRTAMPHPADWLNRKVLPPIGPVKTAQSPHSVAALRSPICANCHIQNFCMNCHGAAMPHPGGWMQSGHEPVALQNPALCKRCHQSSECLTCHQTHKPASHDANWPKTHPTAAKGHEKVCAVCHGQNSCDRCHQTPMPHPSDWAMTHAKVASFKANSFCFKCHDRQKFCSMCHSKTSP